MKKYFLILALIFFCLPVFAGERIPQSIAVRVPLKAYLSSDHVSAATAKTIAIVISKNGGAFGNPAAGATNATEIANGWYYVDLGTGDTDTLGPLIVRGTCATCDDVEPNPYTVVNANTGGLGYLDAAITSRGTGAALDAAGVRGAVGLAAANIDTQLSGISTKTTNLPSDPADESLLEAAIAALNNLSTAQVKAQIDAALNMDSGTELAAIPAAAAALRTQIQLIYQKLRNEEKVDSNAGTQTISNDAGTVIGTANVSDDGTTFTKGEMH
jgi:hypothetical protein